MATTFKIVIPHSKRKTASGNYSVSIRLTHNRQTAYISTPVQVSGKQMSRSGEVTDPRVLVSLNRRIMDMQGVLLDMGVMADSYSAAELKGYLLQREAALSSPSGGGVDLLAFWREFLSTIAQKRTRDLYCTSYRRFAKFVRSETINTGSMNLKFVRDYENWLHGEGVGARGINLYLTHLKRVFNEAKDLHNDEDAGLIVIPNNPFAKYRMPAAPAAKKEGALNREQLLSVIRHECSGVRQELARDCFVMSLFLAGINSADLYHAEADSLSSGWVLRYERAKTRTRRQDRAEQRITVPEYIRPLFDKYRDRTGQRLLNFHIRYASEHELNRAVNIGLKDIGDSVGIPGLYYYQARHSFASIARNRLKYSLDDVGKALTHVPVMRVTDGYVEREWGIVDEVNGAVFRYVMEGEHESASNPGAERAE